MAHGEYDPAWWFAEEPPPYQPDYDPAKEVVGGSAWCNRCRQLVVHLITADGPTLNPYWRGTGRYDSYLAGGERVVCMDCITTSPKWLKRYPWWILVQDALMKNGEDYYEEPPAQEVAL